jgi:hypothetical protein
MSSEFKQFSDASRLYAQYKEVAEKMARLFVDDIVSFLDCVQARIQAELGGGGTIEVKDGDEYRSFWIEDKDTNADDYVPYVWMSRTDSEIVTPGLLTVIAGFDGATAAEKQQVAACASSLDLPKHCKLVKTGLFGVAITLADADPVEAAAGPILSILSSIHRVERKIFSARLKNATRKVPKGKKK